MQIKTIMRYYFTLAGITRNKNSRSKFCEAMEKSEPSYIACRKVNWCRSFGNKDVSCSNDY